MKQTTVRMHMNPQDALGSVAHVIDKDYRDKEVHVSADGEFEIWCDKGVYEIYRENFEDSIKEYNDNITFPPAYSDITFRIFYIIHYTRIKINSFLSFYYIYFFIFCLIFILYHI